MKWIEVLSLKRGSVFLFILLTTLSCGEKNQYIEPPPPKVTVAKPVVEDVTDYLEFTGTTRAVEFVEVRARVSGVLESMHFEPGTKVEKGELLFIIDPRPYQADLAAAQAELSAARVEYKRAETELLRAEELFRKQYLSDTDRLKRKTERDTAAAAIGRAESKLQIAKLNLSYTRVTAPISGRVGRNLVDVGNLVGEGEATLLTNVTKYKPMFAYFHLNERDLLRVMQVSRQKALESDHDPDSEPDSELEIPVFLGLVNEEGYPHKGLLDYGESGVNAETGTLELRGVFPNPGKHPVLLPGLFARLRFPVGEHTDALLVSERAVSADQSGKYLLVINADNEVEKRRITPGQVIDGLQVIEKGIQADDRIIINGIQRARPGAKVNPEEKPMRPAKANA